MSICPYAKSLARNEVISVNKPNDAQTIICEVFRKSQIATFWERASLVYDRIHVCGRTIIIFRLLLDVLRIYSRFCYIFFALFLI